MKLVSWFVLIVAALLLIVIALLQPGYGVSENVNIQGIRVNLSLDEIFKKFMKPGGISPIAILDRNNRTVWDSGTELQLNNAYFDKRVYTILIETPIVIDIESIPLFEREISKKLERIFHRSVFLNLTDSHGESINTSKLVIIRTGIIISAVVIVVAFFLKLSHPLR